MLLLLGAFIAGLLTILAPCVLPLLPIIIGGSISGETKDKKRPLVIAASLAISLLVFTLLLKATTLFINIPPNLIVYISGGIIVGLGIITLLPGVYAKIIAKLGIEQGAQKILSKGYNNKRSLAGPIIIGAALGPVFSSCSPVYAYILATVLPVSFAEGLAYIISYILGLSLVLLLVGYYGQRFVRKIKFASNPKGWFQRIIAILFIIVGLLIITGYDKKFQTYISTHTPFDIDSISAKFLPDSKNKINEGELFNVEPYDAPEFVGLKDWINSEPLNQKDLEGKVVLIDFWTYSCINCIRNNPYIQSWHERYKDDGLVVIGMHAPEFSFEKLPANVRKAVKDQKITYPVALDNNFATWGAYDNRSWPASYLIDAEGKVRRVHEGEGKYKEEEEAIRQLLTENGAKLTDNLASDKEVTVPVTREQTPETYLGTQRASNYIGINPLGAKNPNGFKITNDLDSNKWSLGGKWTVASQSITSSGGDSKLRFKVSAKDVYIVGGATTPQSVTLTLNGKPISMTGSAGSDIKDSKVTIGENKLYRLVAFKKFTKDAVIELTVPEGVELNAFTFGS